jgi:hypothetical protein
MRRKETYPILPQSANINDNYACDEGHDPEPKWQEIDSESEFCVNSSSGKQT